MVPTLGCTTCGRRCEPSAETWDAGIVLSKLRRYVVASYYDGTPPRISEFASGLRLTPEQFSRRFHTETGRVARDVLELEMLRLAMVILETGASVSELSRHPFWGTPRSFYRRIRRLTGDRPSAFAARHRNASCP